MSKKKKKDKELEFLFVGLMVPEVPSTGKPKLHCVLIKGDLEPQEEDAIRTYSCEDEMYTVAMWMNDARPGDILNLEGPALFICLERGQAHLYITDHSVKKTYHTLEAEFEAFGVR